MRLGSWLKTQWREWSLRNSILVLLIPCHDRGQSDAVAALIPSLKERIKRFPSVVVLDRALHHLQDVLNKCNGRIAPHRVVLFAHPTESRDGFAVNASPEVDITVLRADWWMGASPRTIDLLVAHVCEGASVLRQAQWSQVVNRWISFKESIDLYLGSRQGHDTWAILSEQVVAAAVEGVDPHSVRMRIHRAYVEALIAVHDRKDFAAGDTINLCNLERALQALVTSEDPA